MKSLMDFIKYLRKQIFPIPKQFFVISYKMKKTKSKVDFLGASDQVIFRNKIF